MIERKDQWSSEDDLILAETVLHHIRSGSTQLAAFDEVSERLERTPAACGFRWNSAVRKQYAESIKAAKNVRMQSRMVTVSSTRAIRKPSTQASTIDEIDSVLDWILRLKDLLESKDNEIALLTEKNEELNKREVSMTEDYQTLLDILNRARTLGNLDNRIG